MPSRDFVDGKSKPNLLETRHPKLSRSESRTSCALQIKRISLYIPDMFSTRRAIGNPVFLYLVPAHVRRSHAQRENSRGRFEWPDNIVLVNRLVASRLIYAFVFYAFMDNKMIASSQQLSSSLPLFFLLCTTFIKT